MHGEHDAPPVVDSNGDISLFVAATLAALVLAGSALVYRKTYEQQPQRGKLTQPSEHFTLDDMDTDKHQSLDVHGYAIGSFSSTHDLDSKESKSSRSKDRRRRGKDPLKEILKGGKKVKSTTTTPVKQLFTGKQIRDDLDNHHLNNINYIPTPSTPAASFTFNGTPNSFTRGSGKRAQRDDTLVDLPETSMGTTSSVHSRTTSEVSQSNTGSRTPDQHHLHQQTHDRTASSTIISEDHVLTPSQSSASSSRNGTDDNTSISEEHNPDILSGRTRETHPAVPTSRTFSPLQNNDDLSEIVNHSVPSYSSSASSATNTTTASCVITPATSPSLSHTSSKLIPAPGPNSLDNGYGSDCGPKNNPVSEPSHALDTDTKSRNNSRKQQLLPNPTSSKYTSKIYTNASNPWEWDNVGEAVSVLPSSSLSTSVITSTPLPTPTSSLITAPEFPPDIVYRKPPRLQSKSLWSEQVKDDVSSMSGSISHPSLLSPTSGSFVPPDITLLSPSISSSLEKVQSRISEVIEEGEGDESEEVEERDTPDDNHTQLEFPTLNSTVPTLSSLVSNSSGGPTASSSTAGPVNNHRPTTPRRAHGSRRPPTPSGSTPPPHTAAGSASGSGQPQIPAVSTQTQLASLRGALEAARLREEKHKAEMERYTKELETLRWENVNSRRGEIELHNHIRHLMHQLQRYTSLCASVSPLPTSQQPLPQQTQGPFAGSAGVSNPGDGATSDPGSGNGPITTSSPGTQNVQGPAASVIPGPPVSSPPMQLHMLPPSQLNGLSSPVSTSSAFPPSMYAPSSYFTYPVPPPLYPHAVMPSPHPVFAQQFYHMQQQFLQLQQHQPHMQNKSQSPTIQAQQANLIPMLHPPSLATIPSLQPYAASSSSMTSRSRSSSRPGTESTGSLSPDLNGSPSPAPNMKRTRVQTANGYIGGNARWDGTSDSWVVGGASVDEVDERRESIHAHGENGGGHEVQDGFNELLADAIFKRPGSIGVHPGKRSKQVLLKEKEWSRDIELEQLESDVMDEVEPSTEFKFPSLSYSGNVYNGGHNQSSSFSSPVVVSQAPEDLRLDVSSLQMPVDRPPQDIIQIEAALSQNVVEPDNRNEIQPSSNTDSSSTESERTPRREELQPNVTETLMDLNGVVEATNVP